MKKIFKYSLRATYTTLRVPQGAEVLTVQAQNNIPTVWVIFDDEPETLTEEMTFRLVPTGSEFQLERSVFCDTVQLNNGNLVLHVFRLL